MKRLLNILVFLCLSFSLSAQEETRVVDSLLGVLPTQEGREKVKTMIELTWEFYEVSYDDCIDWGEKAIAEAQALGYNDLEADATYALGMQYGYHADLDLAHLYLKKAFDIHKSVGNEKRAFEDLWNQAYFEQMLGNIDSSYVIYENVLSFAEQRGDTFAMANTYANMAVIRYQMDDFESSEMCFKKCRSLYMNLDELLEAAKANANMANLYMEWGKYPESRELYREAISQLEELEGYGLLVFAYKNYGILFEKERFESDSVSYYFDKALQCIEVLSQEDNQDIIVIKADLLLEYGHLNYMLEDYKGAISKFGEVLSLSEGVDYLMGQMNACMNLAFVYSQTGALEKSKYYLDKFLELESMVGTSLTHSKIRLPLMISYARLGRYEELEYELDHFNEEYLGLVREVVDLEQRNEELENHASGLLSQYESQIDQIETLQSQRNHYRMAFYGLLCLCLAAVVLYIAYKIVRKKRSKV